MTSIKKIEICDSLELPWFENHEHIFQTLFEYRMENSLVII